LIQNQHSLHDIYVQSVYIVLMLMFNVDYSQCMIMTVVAL
jgi:hypothetical protein